MLRHNWAECIRGALYACALSPKFLQERLGFLEVGGVKALGEPAVDRRQQLAGFGALALALPQASQAGGGAECPGPLSTVAHSITIGCRLP